MQSLANPDVKWLNKGIMLIFYCNCYYQHILFFIQISLFYVLLFSILIYYKCYVYVNIYIILKTNQLTIGDYHAFSSSLHLFWKIAGLENFEKQSSAIFPGNATGANV